MKMKEKIFYTWVLLAAVCFARGTSLCILDVWENVTVGSVISEDFASKCLSGREPVTEIVNNTFFKFNGIKLILEQSVRLETDTSSVGYGKCQGSGNVNLTQTLSFNCTGQTSTQEDCTIIIKSIDNFPPSFCSKTCYENGQITLNLNESQTLGRDAIFYTGHICDNDVCAENGCQTNALLVNDSSLIGFNRQSEAFNLWLNEKLDFETSPVHYVELTLQSTAHGNVTITLTIHVNDIDDQSPAFTKRLYQCNIAEGKFIESNRTNCKVEGFDQDTRVNATLVYEIVSTFPNDVAFSVGTDGTINVNGKLDRETTVDYVLEIMVYEENRKLYRYNFTTLLVHVIDIDDNSPQFDNHTVTVEIVENLNNGVVIYTPTVTDKDEGDNAKYEYSMEDDSAFGIDRLTGAVSVKDSNALDREKHTTPFILSIWVNSTKTTSNSDKMVLDVVLIDVNDNNPAFTNNSVYQLYILKNYTVGQELFAVSANDSDFGGNGYVTYSLETNSTRFSINRLTGGITLAASLQNTIQQFYQLDVKAEDNPVNPILRRASWAKVYISITDVNLHKPVLTVQHAIQNITENGDVGTIVAELSCTDLDWTDTLIVHMASRDARYFKLSNTSNTMYPTYRITLIKPFDSELTSNVNLQINCTDGKDVITSDIIFAVLDLNDNNPKFVDLTLQTSLSINESLQVGDPVLKIGATDNDRDAPNNQIRYSIQSGNLNDTFVLNATSGDLSLHSALNASVFQQFDLVIIAEDGGDQMLSNITTIRIKILDENNNPPYFLYEPYEATVHENSNSTLLKIHATDPDLETSLNYTVQNCDVNGSIIVFEADYLRANFIDAEDTLDGSIKCRISVWDGFYLVNSTVTIQVQDVNDNTPEFNKSNYYIEVNDTLPTRSLIVEIEARDRDISTMNENITYLLDENSDYSSYFRLDYTSGQLTVQRTLESLSNKTVTMSVKAQDAGSPPSWNTTTISIKVIQTNEHPPVFNTSQIKINFQENKPNFSNDILATDGDRDEISYTIVSGNIDDIFNINTTTGHLTTSNTSYTFDYETKAQYKLIVAAKDNATFPQTASVTVLVNITNINEPPTFLYTPYKGIVPENSNETFLQIHATDPDIETSLNYTVQKCDVNGSIIVFEADYLRANFIDAEDTLDGSIKCRISVWDGFYLVNSTVTIQVQDVNDNTPEFNKSKYYVEVNDTLPTRSLIMEIEARDRDISTMNENITYLLDENSDYSSYFRLDYTSGQLTVQRTLESLSNKTVTMSVKAQDAGSPPSWNTTTISIKVIQTNEHPPVFNTSQIKINFQENKPNFSNYILATDGDRDEISYTIVSGNIDDIFNINTITGHLTTSNTSYTFDYETKAQYKLIVAAKDNATFPQTASVTVLVNITNINEPPTFLYTPYKGIVPENSNETFLQIHATDPDLETSLNYTVQNCDVNGSIIVFEADYLRANFIDAEDTLDGSIKCRISVWDGFYLVNSTVTIQVQDGNDNTPEFNKSNYYVEVNDTLPTRSLIMEIEARDRDISTMNENITYLLDENSDYSSYFRLDYTSGQLTVQRTLESLSNKTVTMSVKAQDAGSPPSWNTTTISIKVIQTNEHPPVFNTSQIKINFQENKPNFSNYILATDDDRDEISYTIVSGNIDDIFNINTTTGHLTTSNTSYTFDYETKAQYKLIVAAKDNATFPQTASVTVLVNITNINEPPTFLYTPYKGIVPENSNETFLQIHATDPDLETILNYTVQKCDVNGSIIVFEADYLRANFIDAEDTLDGSIKCRISVWDGFYLVNSTVTIQVQDVNDNTPEFNKSNYYVEVNDTLPTRSLIMEIEARDRDISTMNENITYLLDENSDYSSYFRLDYTSGQLTVQRTLESLSNKTVTMSVKAQDAGSPPSWNTTTISIKVIQTNEHPPVFNTSQIKINFQENKPNFSNYILATDDDRDEISYSIVSGNIDDIFNINTTTGHLTTSNTSYTFDYETKAQYKLIVAAKDNATFPQTASVTVLVNITNINEPPTFLYTPYKGIVPENSNETFLQIHATDPDLETILNYTVQKCDVNGSIIVFEADYLRANFIDAEDTLDGSIKCRISVWDGFYLVNSTVTIQVQDVNDNTPEFNKSNYYVELNDTLPTRSLIMEIEARDRDISTMNENITYLLDENSDYSSYFRLDYTSGQLTVQRTLESLSNKTVTMSVKAQDAGSPPSWNTTTISIKVIQTNEHPPVFNTSQIKINFQENKPNFSNYILATDGDGDEISYTIVSGNIDDIFNIDITTGHLTTSNTSYTFDYETKAQYKLIVAAKDNATFPQSASVTVLVNLIDINDPPIIITTSQPIYRKINTTAGNVITYVTFQDPDKNITFRKHEFSFGSPQCDTIISSSFFSIDDNGQVRVNNTLEKNGTFVLTAMVTNLNIRRCSNITVIVSNVEGLMHTYKLLENSDVPHTLTELDHKFTYAIVPPTQSYFTISNNGYSTYLITNTQFDYETMPATGDHSLHFLIDGVNTTTDTLVQQIQVNIQIININDNPPLFNASHFHLFMYENATQGDTIGLVTATDADGSLTNLTYSANKTDLFTIDPVDGKFQLVHSWDFDNSTNHEYIMNVSCDDTNFTSFTQVIVTLLDVNDNWPSLTANTFEFNISETASVGAIVQDMWITGSDVDTMDAGKLTYQILPGTDGHYFKLDPNSGNFTLIKGLDFESKHSLELDVMVTDTASHNDTATIKIHVVDFNDNAPRFNQTSYKFTVQEGAIYMDDNFTISATDMDSGHNGQFTLQLEEPYDAAFNLSQQTNMDMGYLHIVRALDRENPEVPHVNGTAIFTVNVIATDHGTPPQSSSALVHIYVEDTNDCPPKFSQSYYNVSVQEGVDLGQQVITFTTTDCDYNPVFTHTNFTLTGQGYESFHINKKDDNVAVVVVAKELDQNRQKTYDLNITVSDGENEVTVNLVITVLDTNDHTPSFNRTTYTFNVTEERSPGTTVGLVTATDEDVGDNGKVTYSITSGNDGGMFEITTNYTTEMGVIRTNRTLDREEQAIYVMIITAEDSAIKGQRQGTCTVTVSVADINDNNPVFNTKHGYHGTVTENSLNSTVVNIIPSITAEDVDFGTNGTAGIRYRLLGSDRFQINDTNGEITVCGNIDRETTPVFNLTIIAEDDEGGTNAKKSYENLTIHVDDVNDCPPKFVNSSYSFSVMENSKSSTSVGRVSVTDDDVSGTQHVRFRIIHGDDEKFYIDTVNASGIIRVSGNIDREAKDLYTLTVTASDGINEGNTTVTIHIRDANDNAPIFDAQRIAVTVQENARAPMIICIVTALDHDQANTSNSNITYSMDQLTNFSLSRTGELRALVSLDREHQDSYEITVFAKDNGTPQMTSSMLIVVTVGDVNDNSPEFFDETGIVITDKTVNIVEKSPVNSVVSLIVARDKDSGENGTILFSIAMSSFAEYFRIEQIDNVTAVVKVAKSVNINTLIYSGVVSRNFSESVTLNLTITARDNGTMDTSRSTNMTLSVTVEAINDATPVFLNPGQPFHISENAGIGTVVGSCKAVVANTTRVHLTYALLDNTTRNGFSIDPENCTIRTRTVLDRERLDMYNFPVMVTDGRTPERTAFSAIQILVDDKNDNPPVFYRPVISLDLIENTNYSQPINVSAMDVDLGNNSLITYSLLNTFGGKFEINTDTGMLTVNQQLDYELQTNFNVTVVATDNGLVPLNATSSVYVQVIDLNDNAPLFYNVNRTVYVKENYVGEIFIAIANDSDSGLNGMVSYRLTSSSRGVFTIDQLDGTVSVDKPFDYENKTPHTVQIVITATDHGNPRNSKSANFTIQVEDVDDFIPTFDKDVYVQNITRSAKTRDVVIDLNATDSKVHYAMTGPDTDYFWIDKDSGVIRVSRSLDMQTSRYILTVTAVDQTHTATCTVIVTVVDHLLTFPHKEYHVDIAEDVIGGAVLVDLNTTEEIDGHEVLYTIVRTEPQALGVFDIDTKGKISCLKSLDREDVNEYSLYITAEPRYARRRRNAGSLEDSSTLVKIVVHVTDVNDNPPVFPVTQKRQFGVPRDARFGYIVTTLQAIDRDLPILQEEQIHYQITDGAMTMFGIQENSGDVFVRRALTATKDNKFNLTVIAFDPTDSAKNDTISIQIHVIENSDRLLLVTPISVEEFRKRQDVLIRNMSAVLGIDVQVEKVEAHRASRDGVISVDLDSSDLYFHGINRTTGLPVPNADIMALINSHSDLVKSLFGHFNVTGVTVNPRHDSTTMGVPEIALISVALLIFMGCVVAIVFAYSTLKSLEQVKDTKSKDVRISDLGDFELGTIRSRRASKLSTSRDIAAAAAINPAFLETEFNTSGSHSVSDKHPTEQESQEIRLEFGDEPIDRNLPEAEVRGSMVHFPSQSAVDSGVGNTSLGSREVLHSDTPDNDSDRSDLNVPNGLVPDAGPVMTSSPKMVRFKAGEPINKGRTKASEDEGNASIGQVKISGATNVKPLVLNFSSNIGETETDDGIESDDDDGDTHTDVIPVKDNVVGATLEETHVDDGANFEAEEITSF